MGVFESMLQIGERKIGEGAPCFITFEAGPTHTGVDSAKMLIDAAADAGVDAIKFQIFDPDRLVADKKQLFSYDVLVDRAREKTETVEEPLYDILRRRYLEPEQWREVKRHADDRGLAFFATVGFAEDIDLVVSLRCDSIKIASADVNHFPLLRRAARSGLVIQLDTGSSTIGEIEAAVDELRKSGSDRIIIHQCPSGYPAHIPSIHLRMIPTLKQLFSVPIAYSDHTPGWEMDVAAVALGANLVEKTITLDRTVRSPEHIFSLEPPQATQFVRAIRDVESALGSPRRTMSEDQVRKRQMIRRSAFAARNIEAGSVLREEDLDFRRPGTGIAPPQVDRLIGATATRAIPAGTMLSWNDVEG